MKNQIKINQFEQYHNFCIKTFFVRKKDAAQNVHKVHD